MEIYKEKVEEILTKLDLFKAPVKVIDVANSYGFVVVEATLDNDESGFIMIDNKEGIKINGKIEHKVICVNHTDNPFRKRFTIAHELGHYFLEFENKNNDESFYAHRESGDNNDRNKEKQADLFAAELLIPTKLLKKELSKITNIDLILYDVPYHISNIFEVSRSCAEIRYERYMRGV